MLYGDNPLAATYPLALHPVMHLTAKVVALRSIAVGETVKVGENFGLRISQIGDVKQIIQALGAARP